MTPPPIVARDYRILVVTPNHDDFELLSKILRKGQASDPHGCRFILHHIDDCCRALTAAKEWNPDLIFLDEKLQCEPNEPPVTKIQRERPDIPIVILTGHSNEFVAANVFHGNVRDFVSKSRMRFDSLFSVIRDATAAEQSDQAEETNLSILIVDNSSNDRGWIARNIERLPSYQVIAITAATIEQANDVLADQLPDCILIDDSFPGEATLHFIRKAILEHPFLPVITLTRLGRESFATESIRTGAQHYLVKATLTAEILDCAIRSAVEQKNLERKIACRDAYIYQCQRKEAEWRERLELVVRSAEAVIWDVSFPSGVVTVNDQFSKLSGHKVVENKTTIDAITRLIHPDDSPKKLFHEDVEPNCEFQETVVRIHCADGSWKWIQSRGKTVECDPEGNPIRAAGIFLDVTSEKQSADEIIQKNEELQRFAHVTSHDLREPLRMITCFTELLRQEYYDQLDQDAQRYIDFANNNAKRMQDLINDLLEYSRFGTSNEKATDVDLNSALNDIKHDLSMAIQESGALLRHCKLPRVRCVATKIYSLLQNLIANSIKYRDPERPLLVDVRGRREAGFYIISIVDNGIGMDQKFEKKIFEPFQRLHGQGEYSGTGIGLAICKRIVSELGGRIWVETTRQVGSTFHFSIPDHLILSLPDEEQFEFATEGQVDDVASPA
ncbi:ATP-binding protein [Rhodopirellula sp. MGV]|uniref:ATP-binding protein n=1 Tax=Rhodopirellula sp. MGV TaxID=2023130 RepID=UPI0013050054|nr:ATP-binding protein [Rhodopirellula sp. MGV]